MAIEGLKGKIQTVLGTIDPEELGITLPHEHLVSDGSCWLKEPEAATDKAMFRSPVSIDTLWWVRYHWYQNIDDVLMLDEQEAVDELARFKIAGGSSVIEMSVNGFGRDPLALARISRAAGLHIIMGSGYYLAPAMSPDFEKKSEQEITDEIVRDITVGVGNTGVRAGIIGEIGCSWPLDPREKKSLKAAAEAQKITGAHLNVHPGQGEEAAFEIVELLKDWGADLNRTTIDHIDRAVRDPQNRLKLAETGVYLEWDLFGREGYYPTGLRVVDMPTDYQKINEIMELIEAGFLDKILISSDIWNKHQRTKYGGWGYAHILQNVLPVMRVKGMTEEQIHTILVENPKRAFPFV